MKTGLKIYIMVGALTAGAWCQTPAAPAAPPAPAAPAARAPRAAKVHRSQTAYLGVDIEDVTQERMSSLKLREARGVEVTLVDADAAAGKAGIRMHDVIVSYNGTPVDNEEQLRRLIRETAVGRTVPLGLMRDGNLVTVQATLGGHPNVESYSFNFPTPVIPPMPPINVDIPDMDFSGFEGGRTYAPATGMVVESLTPQLAEFFGAKSGEGVLVRSVERGSVAEKAGLRAGDVVLRFGDEKIETRADLRRALRNKAGAVKVVVLRDKREQTLTLNVPEKHSQMRSESWHFDFPDVAAEMKDLEPQMQEIQLMAKNDAMRELTAHKDEYKREMEKAKKELERSMKEMNESLHLDLKD